MAKFISPVQDTDLENIKSQLLYADALRKKGMQTDGQMISGHYVAKNPWQNFIEAAAGSGIESYQRGRQGDIEQRQNQERQDWLGQMPSATETQRYDPVNSPGTGPLVEGMEVPKDPRALQQAMTAWGMKAPRGMEGIQSYALQRSMNAPAEQMKLESALTLAREKMAQEERQKELDRVEKGEQLAADRVARSDDIRLRAQTPNVNVRVSGGGSSAGEDTTNQAAADLIAARFIEGDKNALIGISRNKALHSAVMTSIARQASEQGISPKELVQRGLEYTGASTEQKTIGNQAANVAMAANEANQMIDVAADLSKKIPRTEFPSINAAGNIIRKQSGDPNVVAFNQAIDSLVNGYARAINPKGVATVADKKRAHETLNAAFSSGQFDSTVAVMRREMNAALNAPVEARKGAREARLGTGGGHPVEKTVVREVKLKDGRTGVEYSDGTRGFK